MKPTNRAFAKKLRNNTTEAERLLWKHLKMRQMAGYRFRRQHPVGKYIVDFICLDKGLIIELDGGQHVEAKVYDDERTVWLEKQGFHVLRFWDNQVFKETEAVRNVIFEKLQGLPSLKVYLGNVCT
jgi:adenine-specific DNA-methyltransferase